MYKIDKDIDLSENDKAVLRDMALLKAEEVNEPEVLNNTFSDLRKRIMKG